MVWWILGAFVAVVVVIVLVRISRNTGGASGGSGGTSGHLKAIALYEVTRKTVLKEEWPIFTKMAVMNGLGRHSKSEILELCQRLTEAARSGGDVRSEVESIEAGIKLRAL